MIIGIVCILAALSMWAFFFISKDSTIVSVTPQFMPLIFSDKTNFIEVQDLDKDTITKNVSREVATGEVKQGGVEGIYLLENKNVIGLRRLLVLLESTFKPGATNLVSDNFLMGFVNNEVASSSSSDISAPSGSGDFFIIIKMRSIIDIFDSLRAWERKMFFDLHGFFGIDISPETNYLITKDFEDGIIQNKNARILRDQDGKIVLMYVFATENSLIISNTEKAVEEVMNRLAANQIKP